MAEADEDIEKFEPSLKNIIDQTSLKWVFVGGKGGVGKTTTSCCLSVQLAKVREKVLIISTDPAHNISDAFSQKFSNVPSIVHGFNNLYCMEYKIKDIDPYQRLSELPEDYLDHDTMSMGRAAASELLNAFPGIDESVGFAEVIELVQKMNFSCVVIDTAPTGHTLRLLSFPSVIEKGIRKIMRLKNQIGPFISKIAQFVGMPGLNNGEMPRDMEDVMCTIRRINEQLKNADQTTFVCVCIAESFSIYETERLVQELTKYGIDTHNIVVNQLLFLKKGDKPCKMCTSRHEIQAKFLDQIADLYEDFNVTKLPLQEEEVRGVDKIKSFSQYLLDPFVAD